MSGGLQRVFERQCLWQLAPDAYQAGAELLAEAALTRLGRVATVIGITNGGRAPASAIAARVGAPMVPVSAQHNADGATYRQATGRVRCDPSTFHPLVNLPGPFLIVDDICGTGATLAAVAEVVTCIAATSATICTATLCRNEGAPPGTPDLYVWEVADWVVFPWEPHRATGRSRLLPVPREVQGL